MHTTTTAPRLARIARAHHIRALRTKGFVYAGNLRGQPLMVLPRTCR